MLGHARYEALAGALLLGEADGSERALYEAHAVHCARCGGDVDALRTGVVATMTVARELETWSPSVRDAVARRIQRRESERRRRTIEVLGLAIALSLALDAALASGAAQRAVADAAPVVARLLPFAPLIADRATPAAGPRMR